VVLSKDVAISGEADSSGRPPTTTSSAVIGHSSLAAPLPLCPVGGWSEIRIPKHHFSSPWARPSPAYCGGATFAGIKVTRFEAAVHDFLPPGRVLIGPRGAPLPPRFFGTSFTGSIKVD